MAKKVYKIWPILKLLVGVGEDVDGVVVVDDVDVDVDCPNEHLLSPLMHSPQAPLIESQLFKRQQAAVKGLKVNQRQPRVDLQNWWHSSELLATSKWSTIPSHSPETFK